MYFYRWYVHLINIIWTDELRVKSVFQLKFHCFFGSKEILQARAHHEAWPHATGRSRCDDLIVDNLGDINSPHDGNKSRCAAEKQFDGMIVCF